MNRTQLPNALQISLQLKRWQGHGLLHYSKERQNLQRNKKRDFINLVAKNANGLE